VKTRGVHKRERYTGAKSQEQKDEQMEECGWRRHKNKERRKTPISIQKLKTCCAHETTNQENGEERKIKVEGGKQVTGAGLRGHGKSGCKTGLHKSRLADKGTKAQKKEKGGAGSKTRGSTDRVKDQGKSRKVPKRTWRGVGGLRVGG